MATVQTRDLQGINQECGGDPVTAEVISERGASLATCVTDLDNGCYEVRFTPRSVGTFCLKVFIFSRPIKDWPLLFSVTRHNSPTLSFGHHGSGQPQLLSLLSQCSPAHFIASGEEGFVQPCSLAMDREDKIYVMDTGNCRIKVLHSNLVFSHHISCQQLEGRSVTGLCMGLNADTLISVNWRTRVVAEMTLDGRQVSLSQ